MANVRQCCSPLTPPIKRLKATPIVSTRQGLLTRPLIGTYHKQLRTHCLSVWTRQPEKPNTILYTSRDTEENTYIYNIIIEYVCIYIIYLWYTYMIYLYDINKQNTEIFWAWVKWVCICLARFAGFVENRFSFVGCSLVTTVSRHPQCPHDDQIYLALPNTTNIPNMAIYTNLSLAFTGWWFDIWNDCHWIQVELRDDHKCGCAPRAWVL